MMKIQNLFLCSATLVAAMNAVNAQAQVIEQRVLSKPSEPYLVARVNTSVKQRPSSAWSASQVSNLMNNDRYTGGTSVSIRQDGKTTYSNTSKANAYTGNVNNYNDSSVSVSARSAIVIDGQTGKVLYGKDINHARPIASISKLMAGVVVSDAKLDMNETITLQPIDFVGPKKASTRLRVGDKMTRAELLLSALMKSENPAAAALSRAYPGGKSAFVAAMNSKAHQLGMYSAQFYEATGLDKRNVASAKDLAILVSAAYQYQNIRQFTTTSSHTFDLGYRVMPASNTNALVRNGGWNINISKTGFINEAGRCLVLHTTVRNRPSIIVLLGASSSASRTNDAKRLMNWLGENRTAV